MELKAFDLYIKSFISFKFAAGSDTGNRAEFYALWFLMKIVVERKKESL